MFEFMEEVAVLDWTELNDKERYNNKVTQNDHKETQNRYHVIPKKST